jgi:type II secretory pathway component GspD/PulD (secretin)
MKMGNIFVGARLENEMHYKIIMALLVLSSFCFGSKGVEYDPFIPPKEQKLKEWNYVIPIKHLQQSSLNLIFSKLYPKLKYSFLNETKMLSIVSSAKEFNIVNNMIEKLDKPQSLIKISTTILELSSNDLAEIGVDWGTSMAANKAVQAKINFMLKEGKASILANPEILSLQNHEAQIKIGEKIPYAIPVSEAADSRWAVKYLDAGINVRVTTQVVSKNMIKATIHPEVSSIKQWKATPAGEFPIISTREMDVCLVVENGATTILGGLISQTERENVNKVPFLADIPLLGEFFKSITKEQEKTEIAFLVTFEII